MSEIYRGMTQQELDDQYNARATVPDFDGEMARYRALSDQAYDRLSPRCDLAYGPNPDERIDLFQADRPIAPLVVFIHGGYWRLLGRRDSAFMAEALVAQGASVAVVEYSLAPQAGLDQIVDQVRRAVAWLAGHSATLGFDRDRVHLMGSSAGAHLAGMALATKWDGAFDLPEFQIAGAVLASGLYDLEPVRLAAPNAWLSLDKDSAAVNSPLLHLPAAPCPALVTWGGSETAEFKRQSRDYALALEQHGCEVSAFEVADRNHFDILCDLNDPTRALSRATAQLIGL